MGHFTQNTTEYPNYHSNNNTDVLYLNIIYIINDVGILKIILQKSTFINCFVN